MTYAIDNKYGEVAILQMIWYYQLLDNITNNFMISINNHYNELLISPVELMISPIIWSYQHL